MDFNEYVRKRKEKETKQKKTDVAQNTSTQYEKPKSFNEYVRQRKGVTNWRDEEQPSKSLPVVNNTTTTTAPSYLDTARNASKNTVTYTTDMSVAERTKRIAELNKEISSLSNNISTLEMGASRASVYGNTSMLDKQLEEKRSRLSSLQSELKGLVRVGTVTEAQELDWKIADAKEKLNATPNPVVSGSASNRTIADRLSTVEGRAEFNAQLNAYNQAKAELEALERQKYLQDYVSNVDKKSYEDTFTGQFGANYRAGRISQDVNEAFNEYLNNPTAENKAVAYGLAELEKEFQTKNTDILDDEGAIAPWITQSAAGYIPQFWDQAKAKVTGGAIGALGGALVGNPVQGARFGQSAASGIESYQQMRGAAYRALIEAGFDDETARAAANDEAFISGAIEVAGSYFTFGVTGTGKMLELLGNAAVKSGSKNVAVKAIAKTFGNYAADKAAKTAAKEAGKTALRKGADLLGGTFLDAAGEYLEEYTQQGVSIANQNRDGSGMWDLAKESLGTIWDATTGENAEARKEMTEAGEEGFKIGLMFGGATTALNTAVSHVVNAKSTQERNAYVDAIREDEEILTALVEEGKETGSVSAKIATKIEDTMAQGKEVTREQVTSLIAANDEYIKADASQEAAGSTESAPASTDNNIPARREIPLRAKIGGSDKLASDVENRSVEAAFEAGRANAPLERVNFTTSAQEEAYNTGRNVALVRDAATSLGESGSKALTDLYGEEMARKYSPDEVAVTFAQVYNATLEGKKLSADVVARASALPDQVRIMAERAAKSDAVVATQTKYFGSDAMLVKDDNWKQAHLSSKDTRKLDALAKVLGVQIRFAPQVNGGASNAQYIRGANGGVIELALDSIDPFMTSAIHEAIHRIREASPELYSDLSEFVRNNRSEKATDYSIKRRGELYKTDNLDLLSEETVADAFGRIMNDSDLLSKFVEDDRTVAEKILDFIRDVINAVKRVLNNQNLRLSEAQKLEFSELQADFKGMEKTLSDALEQMSEKAKAKEGASSAYGEATTEFYTDSKQSKKVTDEKLIAFLENQDYIVTYKAMQVVGKNKDLYPPMAAKVKGEDGKYRWTNPSVLNQWQEAVEDPSNITKYKEKNGETVGYYTLNKGNGKNVRDVAYAPYEHSSNLVINDQFDEAHKRDNLVVVECHIPVSEMGGTYKAQYAHNATGVHDWKKGDVGNALAKKGTVRKVYLTRWLKPVRILSDAEVAQKYKETVGDVAVPFNVVTPALLAELEKVGVNIDYRGSSMYRGRQKTAAEKATKQTAKYSMKERDEAYINAVNRGDMEAAQKMVDEAAKAAGYTPEHLYHGTSAFGFTKVDVGASDDGISFFATNNVDVAQGYFPFFENEYDDYHDSVREIGKQSERPRSPLPRNAPANDVLAKIKADMPEYKTAKIATEREVMNYLNESEIPYATEAAKKLQNYSVPDNVRALVDLIVATNEDGSYNAWKSVAERYSEFDSIYDIYYNGMLFAEASMLWGKVRSGVQIINKAMNYDPIINNGEVIGKNVLIERYNDYLAGEGNGIYDLYAKHEGQLFLRGRGRNWNDIPLGSIATEFNEWWVNEKGHEPNVGGQYREADTRSIAEFAKAKGYRSVCFEDIYDAGVYGSRGDLSTVYAFFYPNEDVKSADPVTYDDDGNVIPLSERFNKNNNDIRYSMKDNKGRDLSEEQAQYFQNSVARDANGNLLTMYHGTNADKDFTVFNTYGGKFGLFGMGSYFTENEEIAQSYTEKGKGNNPRVYEVYLNATKPLDMDADADIEAWKRLPDVASYFDGCKTNEDCFKALKEYCMDEEMVRWEAEEYITDVILSMGYDSITHIGGGRFGAKDGASHRVYIVFEPEQIKRTDNKTPTNNPDIRYSMKEREAIEALGKDANVLTNDRGEMLIATDKDKRTVMYSYKTYMDGGKEKLIKALRANGHTESEILETISYVDDAADYLTILAAGYAKTHNYTVLADHLVADVITNVKTGKQVMSAIVNNGDYPVNIDLALICKKRVAYMNLMNRLIADGVFDIVDYGGEAIAKVNDILRANNFETACLGCFVESRRLQFQAWAETIVSEWNTEVDKRVSNAEDFGFADGKPTLTDEEIRNLADELKSAGKKNAQGNLNLGKGSVQEKMGRLLDKVPSLRKHLTVADLLTPNGLTALRAYDANLFSIVKSRYGAASPKIVQDFNPYASEIAMITFSSVKDITSKAVKGAEAYRKKVISAKGGKLKRKPGESAKDFKARKAEFNQQVENEAMRMYLYDIGGARIQSFSDFMIENVFDYIQIFADLAAKRLPMHGYTKEIIALRLFGMTGAKWNGSLIAHVERSMGKEYAGLLPASEAKNGNALLVHTEEGDFAIGFDDYARNKATKGKTFIQSIGMKDIIALQLDPRYSSNVGSITIGVSDKQILAMLDSPLFSMVISYHSSGMLPQYARLVGVDLYNDYTDYQNTTVKEYFDEYGNPAEAFRDKDGKIIKIDTSFNFNAEFQKTGDAKKAAQKYLEWCAQKHPVYDGKRLVGYATFNPKFSDSPYGTDFTKHENYYKLLEDFCSYDSITGKAAVQGDVTMTFPSEDNRLTASQMAVYKAALRKTGIFTDKDIAKYEAIANKTFKELVEDEIKGRAEYQKAQTPIWESTVKQVEDVLLTEHPRKKQSLKDREQLDEYIKKHGEIPTGEKPARIIHMPTKTGGGKKLSRTVRTVMEARATPEEALPNIEELAARGDFSYDVYTDKQAIADADATIRKQGWAKSLAEWLESVEKGEVSKKSTAIGWALYNNAVNSGDKETAMTVLGAMVKHQRSAAQALQATRILKKLSPETQLYQIKKNVEGLQEELNDRYGKKYKTELTIDPDLAQKFLDAKTQEERDSVMNEIYRDIGSQIPARFIDKWNAWRYLAMLGNARTHVRNIVGNAGFVPVVLAKDATATAIESVVSRVSGGKLQRSKKGGALTTKQGRDLLKAAWADFDKVQDIMGDGKYSEAANANKQIEEGRTIFKIKPLEMARKGNSAALEAEDMWFSRPHYAYALAQYCLANNISAEQIARGKAIKPARSYAINEAKKATYRDTNAFSQMVSSWGRGSRDSTGVKKAFSTVIEGILPFRKTPANILVRGLEYSPAGLLKSLTYDLWQVKRGNKTGAEAIDNISAGLTGTGLLTLGVLLAAEGLVRGHGGDDEDELKMEELAGHQAYALELPGGESITLDWLAPEALPFFVGVNLWEQTAGAEKDLTLSDILDAVGNVTEPMLEMSMLQGLNDLIDGVSFSDSSKLMAILGSSVTSYLTQGIPTLLGQAERSAQEDRMTTYTEKNGFLTPDMQYTLGKASAKIPIWDFNQIPYIDAWGRKETNTSVLERMGNNFLNPAYTSTVNMSEMEKELMRLYEVTDDAGVFPDRAPKYFTVDGERMDLTGDEYVKYATLKGKKSYDLITELTQSNEYKALGDKEKADAIKDAYDMANQQAKATISAYSPDKWVTKAENSGDLGMTTSEYLVAKTKYGSSLYGDGVYEAYDAGVDPETYLDFKGELSEFKKGNDDKIGKEDVADILSDMSLDDDDVWALYLSEYDSKGARHAYDNGVSGGDYLDFLESLAKADKPTESGKYGTYTQDEAAAAVRAIPGLTKAERAALWQSVNVNWKSKNNPWR